MNLFWAILNGKQIDKVKNGIWFLILAMPLVMFLGQCSSKKEEERHNTKEEPAPQQLTLILVRASENSRMKNKKGHFIGMGRPGEELSVIDDHHIIQPIKIKYAPENDTVVIKLNRKLIQVNFVYKVFDQFNYVFHNGDSVIVEYDKGYPLPRVLNRDVQAWDLKYDGFVKESIHKGDCPSLFKTSYAHFFVGNPEAIDSMKHVFAAAAKTELTMANHLLDSLNQAELVSPENYAFYKQRNAFWQEILKMQGTAHYLRPEWTKIDTLLNYQFFSNYVMSMISANITQGINTINVRNGKIKDYRMVLDRVVANTDLTAAEKDMMLFIYMEQVVKNFPSADVKNSFVKFSSTVKDKALITKLTSLYLLDFDHENELHLYSLKRDTLTFQQILNRQKGKVVYVDFWASWCAPCIASLPAAKKLKEEYKGKDVIFIYLSTDENYNDWIKASEKYGLMDENSFLISNRYSSQLLDDLQARSIPHYLVYAKDGRLLTKDAPDPKSDKVRKIFNEQLQVR